MKPVFTPCASSRDAIHNAVLNFLHVRRGEPGTLPAGTRTMRLSIDATPDWPDGSKVEVAVHCLGQGPSVLLIHGKQSQASDLNTLADGLVSAGHTVWAPDMPGHGHSGGQHLSLPLASRVLHELSALTGPLNLAIGHSFGAASLVQSMFEGLAPRRAVLMASPTDYGAYAKFAALKSGLAPTDLPAFLKRLQDVIGADPESMNLTKQAAHISTPTLVLHSDDDQVAPAAAMEKVASAWSAARWRPLSGLGHFQILNNAEVLRTVLDFANGNDTAS